MERRKTFKSILAGILTLAVTTCQEIYGAVSRWSWPGYPKESQLRKHLRESKNHPTITDEEVRLMTFKECIKFHEKDHGQRRKDSPRWRRPKKVPGT